MHLYRRGGFGLSLAEWDIHHRETVEEAVARLFAQATTTPLFETTPVLPPHEGKLSTEERKALKKEQNQARSRLIKDWLTRMGDDRHSALLERMTLFWHGHFACVTRNNIQIANQLNTIQKHALGNFRDLLLGIAKDVAMIRFLNNQQNRKRHPNENFARELMELFTIGRGNYSEKDVKEAARAFTGWSSNSEHEFVFRARHHDFDRKVFMGRTGNLGGEDIIDILLDQEETSYFICQKIYRYFVHEEIDEGRVRKLGRFFYENNYDIGALMQHLFLQEWFYDQRNIGSKIKSPVELMAGIIRALNANVVKASSLVGALSLLGQQPFRPPNVAGWNMGKGWIDNSRITARLNLSFFLMRSADTQGQQDTDFTQVVRLKKLKELNIRLDLAPIVNFFADLSDEEVFSEMCNWLLPVAPDFDVRRLQLFLQKMRFPTREQKIVTLLMALPEYQLC